MINNWQPYVVALVIGLLVGIEREKAHPSQKTMGVRTFVLISLLGAVAGGIEQVWVAALLTGFCLGLIILSYQFQTKTQSLSDKGLTTEFAAGLIFCLGFMSHQRPALSALMGPMVAMILFSKASLHRFTRAIKPSELEAALLLFLAGVIVISLVPNEAIDPLGIFNPKKFGYLVLTLATLEFSSYVLGKILGEKKSSIVIGFLGGLVSSTAVLLSATKKSSRNEESWRTQAGSALAALVASLVELFLIVGLVSPPLLIQILLPIGLGVLMAACGLFYFHSTATQESNPLDLRSPLDWRGVGRLSIMLALILGTISVCKIWFGNQAAYVLSFLTGLFELHGVSLANATLFHEGQIPIEVARLSIIFAVIASLIAKIAILNTMGSKRLSRALTVVLIPMVLVIAAVVYFTNS